jgi:hypothetical protein
MFRVSPPLRAMSLLLSLVHKLGRNEAAAMVGCGIGWSLSCIRPWLADRVPGERLRERWVIVGGQLTRCLTIHGIEPGVPLR